MRLFLPAHHVASFPNERWRGRTVKERDVPLDDSYRLAENRSGGLRCPSCGGACAVVDSRPSGDAHRRRRKCLDCDYRFTTFERPESNEVSNEELMKILRELDVFVERMSELRGRIQRQVKSKD